MISWKRNYPLIVVVCNSIIKLFIGYSGANPAPLFYTDPARKFPTLLAASRFMALVMCPYVSRVKPAE